MPPLSLLSDDEKLFRDTVLAFAQERIAPRAREMDAAGVFDFDILEQLFAMGLMGVDVPEELGGQGGTFFDSILAIEALAQVDPSAAVIVDVQNTLVNSAIRRWGTPEQQASYLPRLAARAVGSYALSEAASGSDAFALTTQATPHGDGYCADRPQALDQQCR
jgi:short-chain 2-methylacyl-CoA dehydrogenase